MAARPPQAIWGKAAADSHSFLVKFILAGVPTYFVVPDLVAVPETLLFSWILLLHNLTIFLFLPPGLSFPSSAFPFPTSGPQ